MYKFDKNGGQKKTQRIARVKQAIRVLYAFLRENQKPIQPSLMKMIKLSFGLTI